MASAQSYLDSWKSGFNVSQNTQVSDGSSSFIPDLSNIFTGVTGAASQLSGLANDWLAIKDKREAEKVDRNIREIQANLSLQQTQAQLQTNASKDNFMTLGLIGVVAIGGLIVVYKMVK